MNIVLMRKIKMNIKRIIRIIKQNIYSSKRKKEKTMMIVMH